MVTQSNHGELQKPAGARGAEAEAARDDWLPAVPAKEHRFPLEWIDGNGAAGPVAVKTLGLRKQAGLRRQWRPRQLIWTIAAVAWLSGAVTGAMVGGTVAAWRIAARAGAVRAEQMALTSGYRALLFSPRLVAR